MDEIEVRRTGSAAVVPGDAATDRDAARDLVLASRAANTTAAYRSDWAHFTRWCEGRGIGHIEVTPTVMADYIGFLSRTAELRPSTIARRLSGISAVLRSAGHEDVTKHEYVRLAARGDRRIRGIAPRRARPITLKELGRMVDACDRGTARGARDRALLLVGFGGALRASELVALDVGDVLMIDHGLEVCIRRSKTDQLGQGVIVPITRARDPDLCPATAWREWIERRPISLHGQPEAFVSIDRHDRPGARITTGGVRTVLLRSAAAADVDDSRLSPHSLRAGFITAAAQAGASERAISNVSRHRSVPVLRSYVRPATVWSDAATPGW